MLLYVAGLTNSSHNCTVRRSASSAELSQCKLNTWACLLAGPNIPSSQLPEATIIDTTTAVKIVLWKSILHQLGRHLV